MYTYYTGEKIEVTATLSLNGTAVDVSADTVTAILVGPTKQAASSRVTCTKPGPTGRVTAAWQAAESAGFPPGRYSVQYWASSGPYCYPMPEIEILAGRNA